MHLSDAEALVIAEFLEKLLGWQVGTAALFFGMTVTALSLLNKHRKEELALWLMGAMPEEMWSKTFLAMFDGLFYGPNRSRVRFFLVSALFSTIAISAIWYFMYRAGNLRVEMGSIALWEAILIGIAINIVADYLSLLETRFLLSRMPRNALLQILVLILDMVITGAIILTTIWLAAQTGLVPKDRSDPLAVMLAFSIYSAPFYSTFLTSVWSWLYFLSIWTLRVFTRYRIAELFDVEHRPVLFLSLTLSFFVWVGTLGVSQGVTKDQVSQLSPLDDLACQTVGGEICVLMLSIAKNEETRLHLRSNACSGGRTDECFSVDDATRYGSKISRGQFNLYRASCELGDKFACFMAGPYYFRGEHVEQDLVRGATYIASCEDALNELLLPLSFSVCREIERKFDDEFGFDVQRIVTFKHSLALCSDGEISSCLVLLAFEFPLDYVGADEREVLKQARQICGSEPQDWCAFLDEVVDR